MNRDAPPGFLGRWSRRKRDARLGHPGEPQPTAPATPKMPETPDHVATAASGLLPAAPADPKDRPHGADQGAPSQPAPSDPALQGADVVPGRIAEPAAEPATETPAESPAESPALTLDDVRGLTFESDYTRFTDRALPADVRNAAMKKLFFSDPHFNTMDGLDVYIEDYNVYQPLTEPMMRTMVSARAVGLFAEELAHETPALPAGQTEPAPVPGSEPATPADQDTHAVVRSQGNAGPPQVSMTPAEGGLGEARPRGRSRESADSSPGETDAAQAVTDDPPAG